MTKKSKTIFFILSLLLLSCSDAPYYEKAYSFEGKEWKQDVKPEYTVNFDDINVNYNFTLTLRTTTDYKYNNLWIFMKTEAPDGTIAREPFEILITNPDGSWVGNNTGSVVETPLYFKERKLPLKGDYTFTIEQGITESVVDEVLDLDFKVEVSSSEN